MRLSRLQGMHPKSVIQDAVVAIGKAAKFVDFPLREIGILSAWIRPIRAPQSHADFVLYPLDPGTLYVKLRLLGSGGVKVNTRNRSSQSPGRA